MLIILRKKLKSTPYCGFHALVYFFLLTKYIPKSTMAAPPISVKESTSPKIGIEKRAVKTDWLNKLTEAIVGLICPNA